jgi:hypothetical protein
VAVDIDLGMVALLGGDFVLALFPGYPRPGQVHLIGLSMSPDRIAGVRDRLSGDTEVEEDRPGALAFRDAYGFVWQVYASGTEFQSSGESGGRWLEV